MKARIDVDQLRPAVARAAEPAGRAPNLPATSCVLVTATDQGLALQGTDLDLTVTAHTPAAVDQPGQALIPARPLTQFLGKVKGAVTITASDGQVTLDNDDTTLTLRCPHVDDFPKADLHKPGTTVPGALAACARLAPIASTEQDRPILTGVHLSPGRIGVTDSYRGAILDVDGLDATALIPAAAIRSVAKHVDAAAAAIDDRGATFTAHDASCEWRTRLIEGEYPDLDRLVRADSPHHLTVDRHELIEAVDRVRFIAESTAVAGKGGHALVLLQVDGGKLTVTARTQDLGEAVATIACDSDFTPEIAFNSGFLTSVLEAHLEDQVRLELVDSLKPAMTREGPLATILMPVRVKSLRSKK